MSYAKFISLLLKKLNYNCVSVILASYYLRVENHKINLADVSWIVKLLLRTSQNHENENHNEYGSMISAFRERKSTNTLLWIRQKTITSK